MNTCSTCKWRDYDKSCDFVNTTHAKKAAKEGKRFEVRSRSLSGR